MGRLVYLPAGVAGPDPDAFLNDVLTGWRRAHLAQNFSSETVRRRIASVHRMADFVGSYPWQWTAADADDFFSHLRGVRNLAHTTVRAYQTDVKLFLDYATDPAYDWNEHCGRLFGTVFGQVITEFNRAKHVQANDARPLKRPFSLVELQQFFDLADLEPERILNAGRKGALAAWRDAVAFKSLYGWGLRRNEVRHLTSPATFARRFSVIGVWCAYATARAPEEARRNSARCSQSSTGPLKLSLTGWSAVSPAMGNPSTTYSPLRRADSCPTAICGNECAVSSMNSASLRSWTFTRSAAHTPPTCRSSMDTTSASSNSS
jgi:hypothetical protein